MASLFTEVAEATPSVGVARVGLVAKTALPVPVCSETRAVRKLAAVPVSFVRAMLAEALMSMSRIVPLRILAEVTEPVVISASDIAVIHESMYVFEAVRISETLAHWLYKVVKFPSEFIVTPAAGINSKEPVPPYIISIESPAAIDSPAGTVTLTGLALLVNIKMYPASVDARLCVVAEIVDMA